MAARARANGTSQRVIEAARREAEDAEWEAEMARHAKHHHHLGVGGSTCSCGRQRGMPCVVIEPEKGDWEPQCSLCETQGVVGWL